MEILSAALQGGSFLAGLGGGDRDGEWRNYNTGHFFLALDVSAFIEPDAFRRTVGDIMRALRASRRAPGAERIWTAGEKEWEAAARRDTEGVPISPELRAELAELHRTLDLTGHAFLFES
jgi:LDH2 family malate/lactate/ureidoglycolate dehydrogenase